MVTIRFQSITNHKSYIMCWICNFFESTKRYNRLEHNHYPVTSRAVHFDETFHRTL